MDNNHNMITRSKAKKINNDDFDNCDNLDDIDENGNLKDFIDYDMEENEDYKEELKQQLYLLSNKSSVYKNKPKVVKKDKKDKKDKKINNLFIDFLLLKATDKANANLKLKNTKRKKIRKLKYKKN